MFTYHVVNSRYIAYSALALLAEINSVFLHARKLMQMIKVPTDHWFFCLIVYINLFTCIVCRFPTMFFLFAGLYTEYYRLSTTYAIMLASTTPIGAAVDIGLFYRLIKSDLLKKRSVHKNIVKIGINNGHINASNGTNKKQN